MKEPELRELPGWAEGRTGGQRDGRQILQPLLPAQPQDLQNSPRTAFPSGVALLFV